MIIYTQAGPVIGKASDITQAEVDGLKDGLKELLGAKLNYLELETDRGWVIVPGPNVQMIELVMVEE